MLRYVKTRVFTQSSISWKKVSLFSAAVPADLESDLYKLGFEGGGKDCLVRGSPEGTA